MQILNAIGRSDVVLKLEIMKKPVYLVLLIIGVLFLWYVVLNTRKLMRRVRRRRRRARSRNRR